MQSCQLLSVDHVSNDDKMINYKTQQLLLVCANSQFRQKAVAREQQP